MDSHHSMDNVVKFCAEECNRQRSGEISVWRMFDAWVWMMDGTPHQPMVVETILELGRRIDPHTNRNGFRTGLVWIGGSVRPVVDFDRILAILCSQANIITPTDFFREFELVHPFNDGNGRTGAILYNALLGKLWEPVDPPDLGDPNFYK